MKTRFIVITAVLGVAAGWAQPTDAQARLIGRAIGATPLFSDLQELCDRIGGRVTGSPACERAVDWGIAKFRRAGVPVTAEAFLVPRAWLGGSAEAACLAPEKFAVRLAAAPFSSSTNGALEAELVDAGDGTPEAFAKLGDRARGAIALVSNPEMKSFDDLFAEY